MSKSPRNIRLSKSSLCEEDKQAVLEVLSKEYLGMGEEVGAFEKAIESLYNHQIKACCVNSGTAALHLALEACDIGPGDEVLVPSITYVASYQAITACRATPVSCDVHPDHLFIDLEDAKKKINSKTKAIMPVHYASDAPHLAEVYQLAQNHSCRVIEDAAHAFGGDKQDRFPGLVRDIICYSFDGIKNITSGEGGAICTNDEKVLKRIKDARLLGVENDSSRRLNNARTWQFDVKRQGYRYHMSNIMAALGLSQIKRVDEIKHKRQHIVQTYLKKLAHLKEVRPLQLNYGAIIPHIFVVRVQNRDLVRQALKEGGIETGIHYAPNHLLSLFKGEPLPQAESAYEQILSLPCHLDLDEDQIDFITASLEKALA